MHVHERAHLGCVRRSKRRSRPRRKHAGGLQDHSPAQLMVLLAQLRPPRAPGRGTAAARRSAWPAPVRDNCDDTEITRDRRDRTPATLSASDDAHQLLDILAGRELAVPRRGPGPLQVRETQGSLRRPAPDHLPRTGLDNLQLEAGPPPTHWRATTEATASASHSNTKAKSWRSPAQHTNRRPSPRHWADDPTLACNPASGVHLPRFVSFCVSEPTREIHFRYCYPNHNRRHRPILGPGYVRRRCCITPTPATPARLLWFATNAPPAVEAAVGVSCRRFC